MRLKTTEEHKVTPFLKSKFNQAINRKGHLTMFVYGAYGSGKSTYSMLNSMGIYNDWRLVLSNMVFTRQELVNKIGMCFDLSSPSKIVEMIDRGETPERSFIKYRIPCLVIEDSTIEFMGTKGIDEFIDEFVKFYTLIRSVVAVAIWNGDSFLKLAGKLKTLDWLVARIQRINNDVSSASLYNVNSTPVGKSYMRAIRVGDNKVVESFRFDWIPQDIRDRYELKRDSYPLSSYMKMRKALELMDKQKFTREQQIKELFRLATNLVDGDSSEFIFKTVRGKSINR